MKEKRKILTVISILIVSIASFADPTEPTFFRFFYHNKVGLVDQHLRVVIEPIYEELSLPSDGFCSYRIGKSTWGVTDFRGQQFLNIEADRLYTFREGFVLAILDYGDILQDRGVFLNLNGENPFNHEYPVAESFGSGVAPVSSPNNDYQVVLMNRYGSYLKMSPCFYIQPFEEGLAVATTLEHRVGFLNPAGRWAIRPEWTDAVDFHLGLAQVSRGDEVYFINVRGEPVIHLNPKHIDDLPYENWFMNSRKVSGDGYVYALGTTDRAAPQPWNTRTLYYYRDGSQVFMSSFFAIGGDFEEGVASFTGMVEGELTRGFWDTTGQIVQVLPEGFIFVDEVFDSFGDYKSNYQNGWVPIMEKDYRTGTWEGWAFLNREGEVIYVRDIMDQYYREKESGGQ